MGRFGLFRALVCVAIISAKVHADWKAPVATEQLRQSKSALIPFPQQVNWGDEDWIVPPNVVVSFPKTQADALKPVADALVDLLKAFHVTAHLEPDSAAVGRIDLSIHSDAVPTAEGYQLDVTQNGVTLKGVDVAGAFYGVQTLEQMLRPSTDGVHVQIASVRDWPAFGVRGFMHDVGRNFQTIDFLKPQLKRLAQYKLNTFHWHLTDNPGWRIECRCFPQLNDPKFQTRDQGMFYTYAQIRELIDFASALHIRVIPELDVPGHSAYFKPAMGFTMDSPQGMDALEKIIDEFCAEIPETSCPIIHLGSDEIRINDPKQFIARMSARVQANHRKLMVWNPGLAGDDRTINQFWIDRVASLAEPKMTTPFIDSAGGYLNNMDPLRTVARYYFRQECRRAAGDQNALGAILCNWPDVRMADKANVMRYNAQWPGVLAFSESVWHGRPVDATEFYAQLPPAGSDALAGYREFENRLAIHRDRYFADDPFPFVKSSQVVWKLVGPFPRDAKTPGDFAFEPEQSIKPEYQLDGKTYAWTDKVGGAIQLTGHGEGGFMTAKPHISTEYALTYAFADSDRTIQAWIGFETPTRSNREFGGIPPAGKWDPFGGSVLVNDQPLPAPDWKSPGAHRSLRSAPASEDPYTDEEFYWTRPAAPVPLHKGWNKILLRIPCGYTDQDWQFCFIPVQPAGNKMIEDESIRFATSPG